MSGAGRAVAEGAVGESVGAALRRAAAALAGAGVETPRLDAELLLAHALGASRTSLAAHPERALEAAERERFDLLLERRRRREPLPYLLGEWEFLRMPFRVTPAVLIPRPETETLVEAAAARLPETARVLDVGAGSGCVAIGLARLLPRAEVIALEPSPEALAVARENARRLGAEERLTFLLGAFPEAAEGLRDLDAVVSNPPYIPSGEVERLAPELRLYEPRSALDGGPDGMRLLRLLAGGAAEHLRRDGLLALEAAAGQAERVAGLLRAAGCWAEPEVVPDLAGVPRVILARRR